MTPDELDYLLVILASANVLNKLEETSPDVWEHALSDIDGAAAIEAAQQLIRTHRWVKIADVREAARKIREDRLAHFAYQPPAVETDPKYLDRLRGQIRAVASGAVSAPLERLMISGGPSEAVKDSSEGIGRKIPEAIAELRQLGPLGYECPECHAAIGFRCRNAGLGKPRRLSHSQRLIVASGKPLPTTEQQAAAQQELQRRLEASRRAAEAAPSTFVPPTRDQVKAKTKREANP